jgi:hypothetical protein
VTPDGAYWRRVDSFDQGGVSVQTYERPLPDGSCLILVVSTRNEHSSVALIHAPATPTRDRL